MSKTDNSKNKKYPDNNIDLDMHQFTAVFDAIKKQTKDEKRNKLKIKQAKLKRLQESRSPIVAAKLNAASKMDESEQKQALNEANALISMANKNTSLVKTKVKVSKNNKESFFLKLKKFFSLNDSNNISNIISCDDPWIIYSSDPEPPLLLDFLKSLFKYNKYNSQENAVKVEDNNYNKKDYTIETQDLVEASTEINEDETSIENEPPKNIIVKKVIKYKKRNINSKSNKKSNNKSVLFIPPREEHETSFKDTNINSNEDFVNKKKKTKKIKAKEEIKDYENLEEAKSIKNDILKTVRNILVRTFITFCSLIICLVVLFMHQIYNPAFPNLNLENNIIYISITLGCLLLCTLLSRTTIINGLNALFKFKGNSDSAVAFAAIVCIIQCAIALIFPDSFERLGYSIYGVLVLLGLFLNSLGKLKVIRRIQINFNFISSDDKKYAAKIFTDKNKLEDLLGTFRDYEPIVAYQKRTEFLSDFLKLSYEPDPVENTIGHTAPTCAIISIVSFLGALLITKDIVPSICVLTLIACLSIPMTCILTINSQLLTLSKKAARRNSMIVGYPAVKQFCDTNLVVISANELYPSKSITLHGIKSFNNTSIDKVLLDASAVLKRANSPLSKALDKTLNNKQEVLPVVVNYKYLDDLGIEACVKGHRVLIGNRKLLETYNIRTPKKEIEMDYLKNNRYLTYIAIDDKLCAMFIVSYKPNKNMMFEMQRLENNGVNFLITTRDPNITSKMISEHFRIFYRSIKVLNSEQAEVFISANEYPELKTRAYLATKGKTVSMARFISACIRIRSNINAAIITQTMTIALSICLALLISIYSGIEHLRALQISIYSLFWIFLNLIIPNFRKP